MSVSTDGGPDVPPERHESVPPDGRPAADQPAWRKDVPIDWPRDHYVARRDFTKFLGLTSLAFVIGQVWIGVKSVRDRLRGRPGGRPARRCPGRRRPNVSLSDGRRPVPAGPAGRDDALGLRPEMYPPVLRGRPGGRVQPARLPVPQGILRPGDRPTVGRPAAAAAAAVTLQVRDGVVYATGVEGEA
jgi:hypothetical protein